MLFELSIYSAFCSTIKFTINGIDAATGDFGEQYDRDSENAYDYACGNMQFTRIAATKEVLEGYCITEDEYSKICDELEEGLSFGGCGWCV